MYEFSTINFSTFLAAKSHIGALTFSHGGNGDPLASRHNGTFYDNLFDLQKHPVFQPCPGTWEQWGSWTNCDRSCNDGLRIRLGIATNRLDWTR